MGLNFPLEDGGYFHRATPAEARTAPKWQFIGRISTGGELIGTGWLARKDLVLTNAHVAREIDRRHAYFEPIAHDFRPYRLGSIITASGAAPLDFANDIAVAALRDGVELDLPIPVQAAPSPGQDLVTIAGFRREDIDALSYSSGPSQLVRGNLRYALNTQTGMSGSPIMLADDDQAAAATVLGIHINGSDPGAAIPHNHYWMTGMPGPFYWLLDRMAPLSIA